MGYHVEFLERRGNLLPPARTPDTDQAEGMACLPCLNQPEALLIVYDRPDPVRMVGEDGVFAEVFQLPVKAERT